MSSGANGGYLLFHEVLSLSVSFLKLSLQDSSASPTSLSLDITRNTSIMSIALADLL